MKEVQISPELSTRELVSAINRKLSGNRKFTRNSMNWLRETHPEFLPSRRVASVLFWPQSAVGYVLKVLRKRRDMRGGVR